MTWRIREEERKGEHVAAVCHFCAPSGTKHNGTKKKKKTPVLV